jgi:hypothetical protein
MPCIQKSKKLRNWRITKELRVTIFSHFVVMPDLIKNS